MVDAFPLKQYQLQLSTYKTWIVYKYNGSMRGDKMYETTNKTKAKGVLEYLITNLKA